MRFEDGRLYFRERGRCLKECVCIGLQGAGLNGVLAVFYTLFFATRILLIYAL